MTATDFRQTALSFAGATEASHMNHPDFRAGGRIFATLGYPNDECGVLMLTPEQQARAMAKQPALFSPAKGAWGRQGSTVVRLDVVSPAALREWMELAWLKVTSKPKRKK